MSKSSAYFILCLKRKMLLEFQVLYLLKQKKHRSFHPVVGRYPVLPSCVSLSCVSLELLTQNTDTLVARCVQLFPHTSQQLSGTPVVHPMIQLNSDRIYLMIESDPTG